MSLLRKTILWLPDAWMLAKQLRFYLWGTLMILMLMAAAVRMPWHLASIRSVVILEAQGRTSLTSFTADSEQ